MIVLPTIAIPTEARARLQRIVDNVTRNGRGCPHLEANPVGLVCVMHPQLVRCGACAQRHIESHTRVEEFGCDICGLPNDRFGGDDLIAMLCHPETVDTTVSIGRGRRAAVGVVWLGGWAACQACWPVDQQRARRWAS
jgi:hypothetical protein